MPETNNATFRSACLTIWKVDDYKELPDGLQYFAYGNEVCPTTNKAHLQAFAYAAKPMRMTGWKKIFPGAHIEVMRGTFAQNDTYCTKADTLKEYGVRPLHNGQRRDLMDVLAMIAAKPQDPFELALDTPETAATVVQFHSGLTKFASAAYWRSVKNDTSAPEVIYIHGAPGVGKDRYVRSVESDVWPCPTKDRYKWKDSYFGQEAVLYSNVSLQNFDPVALLTEIDRYPIRVPVHGGVTPWKPRRIYITSVFGPHVMARHFDCPQEFLRRITSVKYLKEYISSEDKFVFE